MLWASTSFKAGVNYTFQRSPNIFLPSRQRLFHSSCDIGLVPAFIANTPRPRFRLPPDNPSLDFREHDTFLYGGDDWKIGQNLTLNLGLTWSYYGQPANLFNQITVPRETNPATAFAIRQSAACPVRTFPTFPASRTALVPAVGFAYSPQWGGLLTGHGKTTFRGGYRLLYDPPFYNIYINMASAAPEVFFRTFRRLSPHQSAAGGSNWTERSRIGCIFHYSGSL